MTIQCHGGPYDGERLVTIKEPLKVLVIPSFSGRAYVYNLEKLDDGYRYVYGGTYVERTDTSV